MAIETIPERDAASPAHRNRALDAAIYQFGVIGPLPVLMMGVFIYFAATTDTFATQDNVTDLLLRSVFLMLMTLGQMIVLVSGGFDLSVSAVVSLVSVVGSQAMADAYLSGTGTSEATAVLIGAAISLAVGAFVGLMNGIGVAFLKINAFIVTLATATIVGGVTIMVSGGLTISGLPPTYTRTIPNGSWFEVPWFVLLALPAIIAVYVLTNNSIFGIRLYALGDNDTAAQIAGVRVARTRLAAYVIAGALVAYGAWLLTARVGTGQGTLGGNFTMDTITAAVIGGASLRGGRGSVVGVLMGVIFIQMLRNGMNLAQLDSNRQAIATGIALIIAVLIDRLRDRARAHSAARRRIEVLT